MDIKVELPLDSRPITVFAYNIPEWLVKAIVIFGLGYIATRLGLFHLIN